jgi:hypothetical protein
MSAGRATDELYNAWHEREGFSVSLCIGRPGGDFHAVGESLGFCRGNPFDMSEDAPPLESRYIPVADVEGLDDAAILDRAEVLFAAPAPPDGWPTRDDETEVTP